MIDGGPKRGQTVHQLSDLTWRDVRALGSGDWVAILPSGSVEAHGPHLPLDTDGIIARAMAREGAERLALRDLDVVILPTLAYASAPFAQEFAGTVSVNPMAVTSILLDMARAVGTRGAAVLAVANAHLDPMHLGCLHHVVEESRAAGLVPVVFPDLTKKPWALRLTEEFRSGAAHAGRYETSVIMAERPDLVRDDVRQGLAPNPASLSDAIREGKHSFEEAGGPDAYFGSPAEATAEEGRDTVSILGGILEEAVMAVLDDGSAE
ncbi:MAG: creatininase family protein [Gemmatimonadota bacterium]|nr:MAG: creatininase family protein [Gemmatimonadota bacterium]